MKTATKPAVVPIEDRIARTRAAGERYFQAWVANDLERILAQHTKDSSFVLHGADGVQVWQGIDQVRQVFDVTCRRVGLNVVDVELSTDAFRRPARNGQLGLFDAGWPTP